MPQRDDAHKRIQELEDRVATLERELEDERRTSHLRYRNLFENTPVSIWEEDFSGIRDYFAELRAQGVEDLAAWLEQHPGEVDRASGLVEIKGVNRAALALLGLDESDCLLGSFTRIFKRETRDIFARELVGLWNGVSRMCIAHKGRRKDGTTYDYLLNMYVPCDKGDLDLDSVIVAITDVSELKRAQALREEVDRMARHDLRTPLNLVIGMPEVVREKGVTPEQRMLLASIEEAGYRMLEMINRSLDLYKMERGAYVLESTPVDLGRVVERVVRDLSSLIARRGLQVEIDMVERVSALGEELLCYTMLSNLVKNALEATAPGGLVRVSAGTAQSGRVQVAVTNPGDVAEAMRTDFFAKYATCGKKDGTGLGTYIARLIARTQGGGAYMRTGSGETVVSVVLPGAPGG